MKFTTTLLSLAIASSAAFAPAAFAQSADLSIAGKIFPGACTVDLGGGGIADLGDIRADSLNTDTMTVFEPVEISLAVACESAVRFAFEGVDNAAASSAVAGHYGLGMTPADEKIGGAEIRIGGANADGVDAFWTVSQDSGLTWTSSDSTYTHPPLVQDQIMGFTPEQSVTTGPSPIQALQANVHVVAKIMPTNGLTLTEDAPINGSATLNVIYL